MFVAASTILMCLMLGQAAPVADPLTVDSLRAWMNTSGVIDSNAKLLHDQMQLEKAGLPPWWPDEVYAQQEAAMQRVDLVEAAIPFYQACYTETQARLLAKLAGSAAGQTVTKSTLRKHLRAALHGSAARDAQTAGEDATATAGSLTPKERRKPAASVTRKERAMFKREFTPEKVAVMRECTEKAYAQTIKVVQAEQLTAIHAVIDANRPTLKAAETEWLKEHPAAAK